MTSNHTAVGLLLYGADGARRDAFGEEKYRLLAERMTEAGFAVRTLSYHASRLVAVAEEALACRAILVWVNPTESGLDRAELDAFLRHLSMKGLFVSAHPDVILRVGTKDVLVETDSIGWSAGARAYRTSAEFRAHFPSQVRTGPARVLKRYRGHSGQGVWKVSSGAAGLFLLQPAERGAVIESMDEATLLAYFEREVFGRDSHLVSQAWVPTMTRGMVRAYLCGARVAGFGYQEINALYPVTPADDFVRRQPSRRHYYTEQCMLFQPLRQRLEQTWLPALCRTVGVAEDDLPLLWDADFFFGEKADVYLLCEINASCVSPFPESAITPLIEELKRRLARSGI